MTRINDIGDKVTINKAIDAIGLEHNFDEIDTDNRTTVAGEDMGYIMTILSKLYDRPQISAFREYLSNAVDANIVAARETGTARPPVEVTFPLNGSDVLLIRDYGKGLSAEEMVRSFARYGASDKRNDNTTTGGFGLGSKSALAFASHFKIASTTLIDGEFVTEFAIMAPPGIRFAGSRKGVFTETGTIVEIPANGFTWENNLSNTLNGPMFAGAPDKAIRFRVGSDGDWVDYKGREAHTIGEKWFISEIPGAFIQLRAIPTDIHTELNLFVSGINYPVENTMPWQNREIVKYLNIYLPPGSVSFTPARDSIQFDEVTKNILKIVTEYLNTITKLNIFSAASDAPVTMEQRYNAVQPLFKDAYSDAIKSDALNPGSLPVVTDNPEATFFYTGPVKIEGSRYVGKISQGKYVHMPENYNKLFIMTYDEATLNLTNANHGLTDKILANRLNKLAKGMDAGVYGKISKATKDDFIIVVKHNEISRFVKSFNPKRVESLNVIFEKMAETEKQIQAANKNSSVIKLYGKKVSISNLNALTEKDVNVVVTMSDLHSPEYAKRVVGWYYGTENDFQLNVALASLRSVKATLVQSGVIGRLISTYLDTPVGKDKGAVAIKLRKGANAEKTLTELGFPDLKHLSVVYTEAIGKLVEELDSINEVFNKSPDTLTLANILGGVTAQETAKLVNNFLDNFNSYAVSYNTARKRGLKTPATDAFVAAANSLAHIINPNTFKFHNALTKNGYGYGYQNHTNIIDAIAIYVKANAPISGVIATINKNSSDRKIPAKSFSGYRPAITHNAAKLGKEANANTLTSMLETALIDDLLGNLK